MGMNDPRKTLDRPKIHTSNVNIRVRPDQIGRWRAASGVKGMELSEWMRDALDREARNVLLNVAESLSARAAREEQ